MREAKITRKTAETDISVRVNLDGTGIYDNQTGVGFFDHMLDQLSRHALIDMEVRCDGDLHIDDHHTVEDIGITLGQAFAKALADKKGIRRYGHAYVPLDEALSRVVIDFSGRPGLEYDIDYPRSMIGEFDVDLLGEFFQGFVNHAQIKSPYGSSSQSKRDQFFGINKSKILDFFGCAKNQRNRENLHAGSGIKDSERGKGDFNSDLNLTY